ncbi:hypothetical protein, partial [Escherichia coli]|uniref:hypothetical protein n=1 Tax=Escherichia coli TaxID=562 RepID=UPI001BDDA265
MDEMGVSGWGWVFWVTENPAQNSSESRARSLYLYLRDNSGDKKWHQALRTKASGLICVVEGFGSILLG